MSFNSTMSTPLHNVLFVCLGNICRSPLAEALFMHLAEEHGVANRWYAASAGTEAKQRGQPPDKRTMTVLEKHGITNYTHAAQPLTIDHFYKFNYIFGMDHYNVIHINAMKPNDSKARVFLFGSFDDYGGSDLKDPIYNLQLRTFENLYQKCRRVCITILKHFS